MTQLEKAGDRSYPETPRMPTREVYHGITITDDYQWLEDSKDQKVKEWVDAQNAFTRKDLDSILAKEKIRSRIKELYSSLSPVYHSLVYRGNRFFFMKWDPARQQPYLVQFDDLEEGIEKVVFDPNQYDPTFSTSIDFFVPSKDGKYVAICLSKGGSEDGTLHFFNVDSGEKLPDVLPKVNYPTAGGSVEWALDSKGVYFTRYPREEERPKEDLHFYQQVFFHKLGRNPDEATYVIGKDFPRIAEITLKSPEKALGLVATVANGDGGEFSHFYLDQQGKWFKIADFNDEVKSAHLSSDGKTLFLLSRDNSPNGKILKLSLDSQSLKNSRTLIKAREGSIEDFEILDSRILVSEVVGGPSKLFVYDLNGSFMKATSPSTEPVSSVDEIVGLPDDNLLVKSQSFLTPSCWYKIDASFSFTRMDKVITKSPIDGEAFEISREFATSKDGTRIPINILRRKGSEMNGQNPTILYGYGGYGYNLSPTYSIRVLAWLEMRGIYAIANLRGGGEFGEEWHKQGMLTRKQNVFDDFIACAEYLVQRKYTTKEKLAIEGGSNGGLLMGAALTQRPELFSAVIAHVGVYDMLRVEMGDNGAFNITEYGTVQDPVQFKSLFAYSPYHNVKDGAKYPAVLLLAGENDGRVESWQSKKMAARLQRATRSSKSILLRIDTAGHGFGTPLDQRIAQDTDAFSFLFRELQL